MNVQKLIEVYGDSLMKGVQSRVEIFGDSILKGVQVNPKNLRYYVDNNIDIQMIGGRYSLDVTNHSRFGCTVTKGYAMIEKRLGGNSDSCNAVVMDFGGNDCDFNWKAIAENPDGEHLPNTPIHVFADTYRKIIDLLKKKGILAVLTTLPPLEPQKFFDWFCDGLNKDNVMTWLGTVNTIYRVQERYSRLVEKIASETNSLLVDLRGAFLKHRHIGDYLCGDGAHPNTRGQRIITEAFMEFADMLSGRASPSIPF